MFRVEARPAGTRAIETPAGRTIGGYADGDRRSSTAGTRTRPRSTRHARRAPRPHPDDDGSQRSFALAEVIRTWNAGEQDPIWAALTELVPPRTDRPVDEACEKVRRSAVNLLEALWDAEHQRSEEGGLSLAVFEKLRRSHDEIGRTLDLIRLEA